MTKLFSRKDREKFHLPSDKLQHLVEPLRKMKLKEMSHDETDACAPVHALTPVPTVATPTM